jgi:membrane protein insertase Oxa1/YidC/SpoIIIJ
MMNIMMVVMGFMFFCVPSGLCVYFIASSLWGLAERKLLPPVGKKKDVGLPKERSVWMQRLLGAEPRKRRPKRRGK